MDELIQDHVKARETTRALVAAKDRYLGGDKAALADIFSRIEFLVDFYPRHIQKEDKDSFIPFMKYFSKAEQDAMLQEGKEYDRKMIHRKYEKLVLDSEAALDIKDVKMKVNWMDYL
nr:hypothetical protein [Candidatus Sigynarchaeota archaeon]